MELEGKVVVVTGAGAGIGRAIAKAAARAGASVTIADTDRTSGERTRAEIEDAGGPDAMAFETDVGCASQIDDMVTATIARFGRIDVLVNNAGVTRRAYIMDLTEEDFDWMVRVNFKGVFLCLQRIAREMIPRREGRIINIASIAGRGFAATSNAVYAATKGAVISLTRTASLQLARHDINVNAICPGVVRTEAAQASMAHHAEKTGTTIEEIEAHIVQGTALGRATEPEDIAAMAVFLASRGARNITGQSYNVDGGIVLS